MRTAVLFSALPAVAICTSIYDARYDNAYDLSHWKDWSSPYEVGHTASGSATAPSVSHPFSLTNVTGASVLPSTPTAPGIHTASQQIHTWEDWSSPTGKATPIWSSAVETRLSWSQGSTVLLTLSSTPETSTWYAGTIRTTPPLPASSISYGNHSETDVTSTNTDIQPDWTSTGSPPSDSPTSSSRNEGSWTSVTSTSASLSFAEITTASGSPTPGGASLATTSYTGVASSAFHRAGAVLCLFETLFALWIL